MTRFRRKIPFYFLLTLTFSVSCSTSQQKSSSDEWDRLLAANLELVDAFCSCIADTDDTDDTDAAADLCEPAASEDSEEIEACVRGVFSDFPQASLEYTDCVVPIMDQQTRCYAKLDCRQEVDSLSSLLVMCLTDESLLSCLEQADPEFIDQIKSCSPEEEAE
jgi:hypothetical protein